VERDKTKKIGIGWTSNGSHFEKINPTQHNFTWHMIFLQGFIMFDQGISKKSSRQKCVGSRCHGNQGAKNVKFSPYSGSF
jgi:hypothetical protein